MHRLRFLTAGESHGPMLTGILDGAPAGLALDRRAMAHQLARRRQGYGRSPRQLLEQDDLGKMLMVLNGGWVAMAN